MMNTLKLMQNSLIIGLTSFAALELHGMKNVESYSDLYYQQLSVLELLEKTIQADMPLKAISDPEKVYVIQLDPTDTQLSIYTEDQLKDIKQAYTIQQCIEVGKCSLLSVFSESPESLERAEFLKKNLIGYEYSLIQGEYIKESKAIVLLLIGVMRSGLELGLYRPHTIQQETVSSWTTMCKSYTWLPEVVSSLGVAATAALAYGLYKMVN